MLLIILIEILYALVTGLEPGIVQFDQDRSFLASFVPNLSFSLVPWLPGPGQPLEVLAIPLSNLCGDVASCFDDGVSEVGLGDLDERVLDQVGVPAVQTVFGVDVKVTPVAGIQISIDIVLGVIQ